MKNNIFVHLTIIVLLSVFFCSCDEKNVSDNNDSNAPYQDVINNNGTTINTD